jgi:CHAT domain-containing protein/tetratricopeptide (TPR) repeat protein
MPGKFGGAAKNRFRIWRAGRIANRIESFGKASGLIMKSPCFLKIVFVGALFGALVTAIPAQSPAVPSDHEKLAAHFLSLETEAELKAAVETNLKELTEEFFTNFRALGDGQRERGNFTESLRTFRMIHDIAVVIDNKNWISIALGRIGAVYREQGEFAKAREFLEKSLKMAEAIGDRRAVGLAANSLGNLFFMQGDTESALVFYQKTHDIFAELKNDLNVSRALNNIANIRQLQGNYRLALEYYRQSLDYKQKINEKLGIAWTLNNIGIIHYSQGEYALALSFYERALPIMSELDNKLGQAEVLSNSGNVYRARGEFPKALEFHARSLKIKEAVGNRDGIAVSLHNLGDVHRDAGASGPALDFYRRSLAIREEQRQKAWTAQLLVDIAQALVAAGKSAEAVESAEKGVRIARETEAGDALWQALTLLGRFYQTKKDSARAFEFLNEAVSIIERRREQTAGGELNRQMYFAGRTAPFEAMIELLVAEGRTEAAFSFAERAKARVLLDVLRGGKINITKSLSPAERDRENALAGEIYALNRQIFETENLPRKDENRLSELREKLSEARLEYEAFETALYNRHAGLKFQRGLSAPLSLAETQNLLPDAKTVLLEFAVGAEKTFLFSVTKKAPSAAPELRVRTIPLKRAELARRAAAFREAVAGRRLNFRPEGRALFDALFGEIDLRGREKIIIVPDAELWQMPFQALPAPDGQYLIERAEISSAQSLTTLAETRKNRRAATTSDGSIVAFANAGGERAPLPFAQKQIDDLRQLYGPEKSLTFSGGAADEAVFKREAGKTPVIHLAMHGFLDDANPMYSYLQFSAGARTDDGFLEAWEIMRLELGSRLVVLSACETARGRFSAGEGLIGMSWAFFVAGAPTVLVSQWKVEEVSTAELMSNFHRRYKLQNQTRPAAATRAAVLKMLAEKKFSHPFYWAGFVVVGDGV